MKKRDSAKKNLGFTLVELIVVIAIMAIVLGAAGGLWGILNGKTAKDSATRFNSALSESKVDAMAKSKGASYNDVYVCLYVKDGKIMLYQINDAEGAENRVIVDSRKLASVSRVTVTATSGILGTTSQDAQTVLTEDGDYLKFAYNRADGSFNPVEVLSDDDETGANTYYKQIDFKQGSYTYHVTLTPKTGKVELTYTKN